MTSKSEKNKDLPGADRSHGRRGDAFDPLRKAVLEEALTQAPFDGWTALMLRRAGASAGADRGTMKVLFPDGVRDCLRFWSELLDASMLDAMQGADFKALKIREKVAFSVRARLADMRPHKEAARRAAALFALPSYAGLAARLSWRIADTIWRGLGDMSTDINFYSKRAILSGVWTTTFTRWLGDDSEDEQATMHFLDRRIDNVMQIEKVKAKIRNSDIDLAAPLNVLSRLRYPGGRT